MPARNQQKPVVEKRIEKVGNAVEFSVTITGKLEIDDYGYNYVGKVKVWNSFEAAAIATDAVLEVLMEADERRMRSRAGRKAAAARAAA